MHQMTLKFNSYAKNIANANVINNSRDRIILHAILFSIGALAVVYLVLLGSMVRNILERRSLEVRQRALSSEVGDLELTFLSLSGKVNLPLAYSLGFREAKATFATRKSLSALPLSTIPGAVTPLSDIKAPQNEL
jgi:hypothetical protein